MFQKELIESINKKYNFRIKIYDFDDLIEVDSGFEQWFIKKGFDYKGSDCIILYHKNRRGRRNFEHKQRKFYTLNSTFMAINNHKNYCLNKHNYSFRLNEILKKA